MKIDECRNFVNIVVEVQKVVMRPKSNSKKSAKGKATRGKRKREQRPKGMVRAYVIRYACAVFKVSLNVRPCFVTLFEFDFFFAREVLVNGLQCSACCVQRQL